MTRDDEGQLDPTESPSVVDPTPLRDATGEPDPSNYFAIGASSADRVHMMNPPRGGMSRVDSLRLVAWVATLAELRADEIASARRQVEAT